MIMKKIITPSKPIFYSLPDFYSAIWLKKSETDISNIKERAQAERFAEQTKKHITIIGGQSDIIIDSLNKMEINQRNNTIEIIKSLLEKFDWQFEPGETFWITKEGFFDKDSKVLERRESYIRVVDLPDMEKFYQELNKLLHTNIPAQFPHITLFSKGENEKRKYKGISIPSKEEFKKLNPQKI